MTVFVMKENVSVAPCDLDQIVAEVNHFLEFSLNFLDAVVSPLKEGISDNSEISDWHWKIYSFEVNRTAGQLSFDLKRQCKIPMKYPLLNVTR
jgi:hypothetical protein